MQLLLRKVLPQNDQHHEYLDVSLDGDTLTIGSSPRCDIQILGARVRAIHGRFSVSRGVPQLRGEKKNRFGYQGKAVNKAELNVGDEFAIDDQRFIVLQPPAGFDLALEWHYQSVPGHLLENAYRTKLSDLSFNTRLVSWALVFAVLIFAGAAPVLDFFWRSASISMDVAEDEGNAWYRQLLSPDAANSARPMVDTFWLSGPLLPAHEIALGDRCEGCHQEPFVQVKDEACTICHDDMGNHVVPNHPEFEEFGVFRCQNCHKEHSEPLEIVSRSDRLCNQCHAGKEPSVVEFSSRGHPEFIPTLLQPEVSDLAGVIKVDWKAERPKERVELVEQNNLKYPHDLHLNPDDVTHSERGDALLCADCHELNQDGEHFRPISMERHCMDCHDLSYGVDGRIKRLPHGDSKAAYDALQAYYVELAFNPVENPFERRRLPGQRSETNNNCEKNYDCAIAEGRRAAQQQFEQSGCITCHEVNEMEGAEPNQRWQVLDVRLSEDWHPDARFDHQSHLTPSNFIFGEKPLPSEIDNALCLSCHRADLSESSTDVLMPQRSQCTGCHGRSKDGLVHADFSTLDESNSMADNVLLEMSPTSEARVTLNCIACHGYHNQPLEQ